MASQRLRILLADQDEKQSRYRASALRALGDCDVVGIAKDGRTAMELIQQHQIDVVVLDIVLAYRDGLAVLEDTQDMPDRPAMVVLTALSEDSVIQRSMAFGASDYVLKPTSDAELMRHIARAVEQRNMPPSTGRVYESSSEVDWTHVEDQICRVIQNIGIMPHLQGYYYLKTAILLVLQDSSYLSSITQRLYPSVAQAYDTLPGRVERSIRHAIEHAWNRANVEVIDRIFGYTIDERKGKPTNSAFIARVAEHLRLSQNIPSV
nr:sporulation transcription factor Spo0A [Maliibacterium massiliense]